uniref:Uncharacterized protein n=1 Tax=Physcomitrium patens TaxID=3218 RepID=A0A2K1IBB7_PHYPA|nr:hypothetical protein PHYPA_030039 [Physcomitrium patens]
MSPRAASEATVGKQRSQRQFAASNTREGGQSERRGASRVHSY